MKTDDTTIRQRMADWLEAVRMKDTERLLSHYASNVITFDIAPPFMSKGRASLKEKWLTWMNSFEGPIGYEPLEQHIEVDDDTAFVHGINRVTGKQKGHDEPTDMAIRVTVGLKRIEGRWLVVHEHVSVPIDMKTMKGMFVSKP